ncbi:MAG TPA: cytochrome c oxidase subunit II [Tepidisphaeraceae bacterium]|jgi:cytochrome c oxidase subunit 2
MFGFLLADTATSGNWLLPPGNATIAAEIDWLTWFILWVCIIFGGLVFLATILISIRYRFRAGVNEKGKGPTHSTLLEIVWSVIPGIIVLLIAIWGFQGYINYTVAPQNALEIQVEGRKWNWAFTYPNGYTEDTLHVPKGVPIRLIMSSQDVIHSLYFPTFRIKKDVVPGRYNKMWFTATEVSPLKEGLSYENPDSFAGPTADKDSGFPIYCTEYCGTNHSTMLTRVHVHPDTASYQAWLDLASDPFKRNKPPVEIGAQFYISKGCATCHSSDGTTGVGPTWKDLFGKEGKFQDGATYVADENYIRESILYPTKHLVQGYPPNMPSYLGKLSDREISALVRYMKSISTHYKGTPDELKAPVPEQGDLPPAPQASAK